MEERVRELRCEIVNTIKDPLALQYLIPAVISENAGRSLKHQYRVSAERANHKLLDLLFSSKEPGKWTAFLQALQKSEHTYLARLLQSNDDKTFNTCSRLIYIFAPHIEQRINPAEMLARLRSEDVISERDQEVIMAKQTNEGAISAAMVLIERIQIHLAPEEWYTKFLKVLHEYQHSDLVALIDPAFDEDATDSRNDKEELLRTAQASDNAVVSMDRRDTTDSLCEILQELRAEILLLLNVPEIVTQLAPTSISQEKKSRLIQLDDTDHNASANELLDFLIKAPTSVHIDFIRCLRTTGYQYLANLLTDRQYKTHCKYLRKLIALFEPTIQNLIDPADILAKLISEDLINTRDKDRIMTAHVQYGKTTAAMVMLDAIQCRLDSHEWYTKLLQILVQTNQEHVVRILEPDFLDDPGKFTTKLYEKAHSQVPSMSELSYSSENCTSDIDKAIGILQERISYFLYSAECARKRLMSEKKKVDDVFDKQCSDFEDMVRDKRQHLSQKISKLKEQKQTLETRGSSDVQVLQLDNGLLPDSDDDTIILFRPKHRFESFGDFSFTVYKEESVTYPIEAPKLQNKTVRGWIPKYLLEERSISSSYLEVSDNPQKSSDKGSSVGNLEEVEAELNALKLQDFFENDEYVFASNWKHVYFEILRYSVSEDIHLAFSSDMALSYSGKQLVGPSSLSKSICIFDLNAKLLDEIPCENQYNRIAMLTEDEFAMISIDESFVHVINTSTKQVQEIECSCPHSKCTICRFKIDVYILCSGKHLHILSYGTLMDIELGVISSEEHWRPTFASMNFDKTKLFVTEALNNIYCFDPSNGHLLLSAKCVYSNESILVCGLVCLDDFVLVVDKYNNCISVYTAEGWLYKDTIEQECFTNIKVVAIGTSADELVVVRERKAEETERDYVPNLTHYIQSKVTRPILGSAGVITQKLENSEHSAHAIDLLQQSTLSHGIGPIAADHTIDANHLNTDSASKYPGITMNAEPVAPETGNNQTENFDNRIKASTKTTETAILKSEFVMDYIKLKFVQ